MTGKCTTECAVRAAVEKQLADLEAVLLELERKHAAFEKGVDPETGKELPNRIALAGYEAITAAIADTKLKINLLKGLLQ